MPPEGFRARVNTNVVPVAPRQGGGAGGAIAEGLQQLGQTGSQVAAQDAQLQEQISDSEARIAAEQRRREIAAHSADRIGAWAQLQADVGNDLLDIRQRSKPGAVGHKEEAIKLIRGKMDEFLGTLAEEPEVRQRFEPMLVEYEARTLLNEGEWELQSRVKHQGDSWASYVDTTANQLLLDPTPGRYQQTILDGRDALDLMDIDGTTRAALDVKLTAAATTALKDGMLQAGQVDQLEALVKSGFLNDKGIDLERTINEIGVERNQARIEAERIDSRKREDARDALQAMETRSNAGAPPSAKDIAGLRASIVAAGGDESDIARVDVLQAEASVARYYPSGTPSQAMGRDADMLRAKVAAGKASQQEKMTLTYLDKRIDAATLEEAKQGKTYLANGVPGRMQALAEIGATDAKTRFDVAEKIEKGLGQVAMIRSPVVQEAALQGMADLKANAKLIDAAKADAAFRAATRTAGQQLSEDGRQQMIDIANGLYVHWLGSGAVGQEFNPKLYQKAVRMAYGGYTKDGEWHGGLGLFRGRSVELPDDYTDARFDRVVSRMTFADAVYADKSPASKADILQNYTPIFLRDDANGKPVYGFVNSLREELKHKSGVAYIATMP